ncbi:hypothetical protein [Lysinibacillus sp. 3P01SB]|uniref:hypothetical protein n=1 Tax=Lysinibacillus sp. 3P01SB TaxID=3132284 RepID=UPI0039A5963B
MNHKAPGYKQRAPGLIIKLHFYIKVIFVINKYPNLLYKGMKNDKMLFAGYSLFE